MTATTSAPAALARTRRASRPPRRRGRRALAALAAVVVVALVGAWFLVGTRAWVQPDGTSSWSPGLVQEVGSVTGLGTGVVWLVDDDDGWVLVGVRNTGPLPVTLAAEHLDHAAADVALEPEGSAGAPVDRLSLAPGRKAPSGSRSTSRARPTATASASRSPRSGCAPRRSA